MSMISAQCDELRELAARYDELQAGAVKEVTMPSDMGSILREAADTIWELRCRLVDAEDRVRKSGELCKLCEREAENTKGGGSDRRGCRPHGMVHLRAGAD